MTIAEMSLVVAAFLGVVFVSVSWTSWQNNRIQDKSSLFFIFLFPVYRVISERNSRCKPLLGRLCDLQDAQPKALMPQVYMMLYLFIVAACGGWLLQLAWSIVWTVMWVVLLVSNGLVEFVCRVGNK